MTTEELSEVRTESEQQPIEQKPKEEVEEVKPLEIKEKPQLTLAEWKAQQKNTKKTSFNTRQAGEDKKLKNFVPLTRQEGSDELYEYIEIDVLPSKRAQKTKILDIAVNFTKNVRESNKRDDRRQVGRDSMGAGASASDQGQSKNATRQPLKLDDVAFPILS